MEVKHLSAKSIGLIAQLDRSEYVDYAYCVRDQALERYSVDWDVPTFKSEGTGPHTVRSQIDHWRAALNAGGILFAAFDRETLAGLAIVDPEFELAMAWLAYMHVSRPYRRQGVGRMLWDEAEAVALSHNATSIYVSAVPSGPAIDFYLSRGCQLVNEPHPQLFAEEPEDIHLIKRF